jgi:D-hydroxyproline dehydrogenase subunit beta
VSDVAVIGGGIVGCALAAFLAEGGATVRLYEREAIAAGASGRNSGVVQDPLDPALSALYAESLEHYRGLGHGFALPADPVGLLIVGTQLGPAPPGATLLEGAALRAAEPTLADGLMAHRLETGRPVPPAAAARAFAERARAAGAQLRVGAAATLATRDGRGLGVTVGGALERASAVAVAAGPWTPAASGLELPISPLWGVVVEMELAAPPTHVIEEAGVEELTGSDVPGSLFSIVTARGISAVGSTFLPHRPDAEALAPGLIERGARFVPGIATARRRGLRACARPVSADGRPLLGPLPGLQGVVVASGHGAWGVTLGPASARLVADGLLGRPADIPPQLAAGRWPRCS